MFTASYFGLPKAVLSTVKIFAMEYIILMLSCKKNMRYNAALMSLIHQFFNTDILLYNLKCIAGGQGGGRHWGPGPESSFSLLLFASDL